MCDRYCLVAAQPERVWRFSVLQGKLNLTAMLERLGLGCLCHGEREEEEVARTPLGLGSLLLLENLGFICWGRFSAWRGSSWPSATAAGLAPWGSGTLGSSCQGTSWLCVPRASPPQPTWCWCFCTLFPSFAHQSRNASCPTGETSARSAAVALPTTAVMLHKILPRAPGEQLDLWFLPEKQKDYCQHVPWWTSPSVVRGPSHCSSSAVRDIRIWRTLVAKPSQRGIFWCLVQWASCYVCHFSNDALVCGFPEV